MQDLRQDLRQQQDYRDGGDSQRGGGGRGGSGGPPFSGGRGGSDFGGGGGGRGGRGPFYRSNYEQEKFERVQKMRQESRASMRKRQILAMDISPTMTAPNVLAARDAALAAPLKSSTHAVASSSYDHLPYEPRSIMHDAFHTREPPMANILGSGYSGNSTGQQQQLDAGDLAVALETALETCRDSKEEKNRLLRSKIGGKFLVRPDQEELVRKSSSGSASKR
jgi:hypothetical protein